MDFSTWLAFFAASWAISISPGAGAVAAMSAGLNHGFKRGYITTVGLVLGIWTQLLVVGVGLGALVATSGTAFLVIKWLGVAYLVWLGVQQWRAPARPMAASPEGGAQVPARTMVLKGWMINAVRELFAASVRRIQCAEEVKPRLKSPRYVVYVCLCAWTKSVRPSVSSQKA